MASEHTIEALNTIGRLRLDPLDGDLLDSLWVLQADDPDIRNEAAESLEALAKEQPDLVGRHYDEVVDALWEPLNDDELGVRSLSLLALARVISAGMDVKGDRDTDSEVQMLTAALTSPDTDIRFMAAEGLTILAEPYPELVRPHVDALDRAIDTHDELEAGFNAKPDDVADSAAAVLAQVAEEYPEVLDDDMAIERILSVARDHPNTHLFYTAGMIAAVHPSAVEPYVEDWVEMLDAGDTTPGGMGDTYDLDTSREQRAAAAGIEAIASHEPSLLEPHLPGLISTLRTSESAYLPREDLARALGDVGDPAALDALRWLRDTDDAPYVDSDVRAAAEEAIQKIGPKADESSPVAYVHEGEGDVVAGDQSKAVDQRTTVEDSVINRSNVGTSSPESDQDQDDGTDISFCPSCGTDLSEWDVPAFCPSCGTEL